MCIERSRQPQFLIIGMILYSLLNGSFAGRGCDEVCYGPIKPSDSILQSFAKSPAVSSPAATSTPTVSMPLYCPQWTALYNQAKQIPGNESAGLDEYSLATLNQSTKGWIPEVRTITLEGEGSHCDSIVFSTAHASPKVRQMQKKSAVALVKVYQMADNSCCQIRINGEAQAIESPPSVYNWEKYQVIPNFVQISCRTNANKLTSEQKSLYHVADNDTRERISYIDNYIRQADGSWRVIKSTY